MSVEKESHPAPDSQSPLTPDEPKSGSDNEAKSESTAASSFPAAKLAAVTGFLSMLNPFGAAKDEPQFPPSDWGITSDKNSGAGASDWDYDLSRWKVDIEGLKDFIKEEQKKAEEAAAKASDSDKQDEVAVETPLEAEAETLAHRVRTMLENIYPSTSLSVSPNAITEATQAKNEDAVSQEVPSSETNTAEPLKGEGKSLGRSSSISRMFPSLDWKTRTALFSDTVMNGAEKGKESVFAILERMNTQKSGENMKGETQEAPREGVMVYAPLSPDDDSVAELADSDTLVDDGSTKDGETSKVRREWHPSPTKLSLQATWWGYRLYLPPPVLAVLSDAHLTAVKRGALISASLKWLLDQIPLVLVPIPLKPSVLALKRLSPYLGYVGAFVAWSWEKIKSKDQGNGVVLSATWALPVALVPASWDYETHGYPQAPPPSTKKSIFRKKSGKSEQEVDKAKRSGTVTPSESAKGKEKAEDEYPSEDKK